MNAGRRATKDEIEKFGIEIAEGQIVYRENLTVLQDKQKALFKRLEDITSRDALSIDDIESRLTQLKMDHANRKSLLQELEERWKDEAREEETRVEIAKLLIQKKDEVRKQEGKEYFAALWIQLRWKTYRRRQLLKIHSVKGKK
ncbi:hypothetical protein ACHAW6_006925, partial [Cyclotella cf. meneghiniana]